MAVKKERVDRNAVAQAAGVSPATVSLVVRDSPLVKASTKEHVQRVIEQLGYEPHAAAAALRSARSQTLGYTVNSGEYLRGEEVGDIDTFHNHVLRGMTGMAEIEGQNILVNSFVNARRCFSLLNSHRVDGLLVDWDIDDAVLDELVAREVPLVVVGRAPRDPLISYVKADEEEGAYTAVRHLLSLGHQRIGLISGNEEAHPITDQRIQGYRRALTESHLEQEARFTAVGDWSFESGYRMTLHLLAQEPRPTALFVLGEVMAAGALKAARRMGLCVPDDVALVTVASTSLVEYTWPELTALHVPMYEVGKKAVEMLLRQIRGGEQKGEHLTLPTTLLIRESSAPARVMQKEIDH